MNENAVKIQIALSALEHMNVPASEENVNKLTVIWQMLRQVRDNLGAPEGKEGETDGNA